MSSRKIRFLAILGAVAALLAGLAAGRSMATSREVVAQGNVVEVRLSSTGLTSPLLACEEPQTVREKPEVRYFNTELKEKVAEIEAREGVNRVAVYFRDLENGLAIGVNQDEQFVPASLSKVPLMIACLKIAELDPGYLNKKIRFPGLTEEWMKTYHYPPAKTLEVGKEYTVSELLEYTIAYSDNAATWLLFNDVPQNVIDGVLYDLGLNCSIFECRMSAAAYGRFFRILYNASYLSDEMSEKALTLLSKCQFGAGIISGLPSGVTVAHKFGEIYKKSETAKPLQLHDCGIVYVMGNPYLLCVMTGGQRYEPLEKAIQDVSRFVYDKVSDKVSSSEKGFFQIANL